MKTKFKSIIMISIIFLSTLIVSWNFNLNAKNLDNEMTITTTSRSNRSPRAEGFNWETIEVISEPIFGKNLNILVSESPKVAVEGNKIYIVWYDWNNTNGAGTDWDIFYRYFDGNFWSKIEVISEPIFGQNFNTGDSMYPSIAVENGKIYVVWRDNNNTNNAGSDRDIFYRCNLTGKGWEDIQVISEPIFGQNFNTLYSLKPTIAIENGKIYVVWHDKNNTNNSNLDYDIFYRCNLTGSGWEDIQVISEPIFGQNFNTGDSMYPRIAVENGKIYVVWRDNNNTNNADVDGDIFYRCNFTGSSWEPIEVISEPVQGQNFCTGSSSKPSIAVENGKIYIIWRDNNNTNNAGTDYDIFYRCNLTGNGWEDIQVISEPIYNNNSNVGLSDNPKIVIEDNKIYVVWSDNANINNAGLDEDIFFRCNYTSFFWEPVQVISEPVGNKSFNTGSSIQSHIAVNHGKIYIVWQDSNLTNGAGSDSDIFYRSISLTLVFGPQIVTPTSGNSSTIFNFTVTYFHLDNKPPTEIAVYIDDIQYLMSEVNPIDNNFIDGKDYFFNITNLDIGVHTFQFYSSDGLNSISTELFNKPIICNSLPKITTEDNITAFEDVYYEMDYEYEDIDIANIGQIVSFSNFSTNAFWLNFNNNTGLLNGTPTNDDVGEYWINISINDTIDSDVTNFTLKVINVNDAPNIITNDIKIAIEDELYDVVYEAIDIDTPQNNLIWTMNSNSSWLGFDQVTAKLSGTPKNDEVGESWVNISVSDTEYINYSNFTLKVLNENDPPRIITKNNITAIEDEFYEVIYKAEDLDNTQNELFWDINSNAKWLNYNIPAAIINGTPTNEDIGKYWVNISVSDNEFIDFTNFTLAVINTNDPPMIITEDKIDAIVGELYSVNYEVEDIDPPQKTFTWSVKTNTSAWLTIDSITGWLNGIPSVNDVGSYWVNISVSDRENGFDYHNFTLTVYNTPNQPPIITTEDKLTAEVDIQYSVDYEANDDRTQSYQLQWHLKTNASWLNIDSSTGILTGIPKLEHEGTYWVEISVTDNENGWDIHNFTLQVIDKGFKPNNAPVLSNPTITPSKGDSDTMFTFSVHYFDMDGNDPEYVQVVIDSAIYKMELKSGENASNGIYEYSRRLSEGIHSYYFMASDGLETVKIDNLNNLEIKKSDKVNNEKLLISSIIVIFIIIMILIFGVWLFIFNKRKAAKIPTVRAELLFAPPDHVASAGITAGGGNINQIASQPIVSKQLPTQTGQVQPTGETPSIKVSVPSLAPTPVTTQYQLPQATLTKAQRLGLLKERFLRGEVSEEIYKEFKTEIEGMGEKEISVEDSEDQSFITEAQQSEATPKPPGIETSFTTAPEFVGTPPQQIPIVPEFTQQPVTQSPIDAPPEQPLQESHPTQYAEVLQPQPQPMQPLLLKEPPVDTVTRTPPITPGQSHVVPKKADAEGK